MLLVLFDEILHNAVYAIFLLEVLLVRLLFELLTLNHLLLNVTLVIEVRLFNSNLLIAVRDFLALLLSKHLLVDVRILLHLILLAELHLCDLCSSFLVQVRRPDLLLQHFDLIALGADLLDLARFLLRVHLHARHLASQLLLHLSKVDVLLGSQRECHFKLDEFY